MSKDTTNYVGVGLFPSPLVLLYSPRIDDISNKIESITGIVLQKVVECFCLAVTSTKMNIGDKNSAVCFDHATIYGLLVPADAFVLLTCLVFVVFMCTIVCKQW
jgi:hypothetical protein